jgi:hypothetical protein
MLRLDEETLRLGLERASDLFRLHRLSGFVAAEALEVAVFENFGVDEERRAKLVAALVEMLPVTGDAFAQGLMASSMCAGVLVGLLLAQAAVPAGGDAVPDCPPADL